MVFSSIVFIFAFLPITLILYYVAPEILKNPVLLLFSLIFYAWGEPVYVILMMFSIVFNYVMGLDIEERLRLAEKTGKSGSTEEVGKSGAAGALGKSGSTGEVGNSDAAGALGKSGTFDGAGRSGMSGRLAVSGADSASGGSGTVGTVGTVGKSRASAKRSLIVTILVDIGLLAFFKYYGFFVENLNMILPFELPEVSVDLPVGISFYTFQTLSYVIDIYRKETPAQRNLIAFGTYVTMFPQLIAGPIVQYKDINEQLTDRKISFTNIGTGAAQFVRGLTKKVVFANNIGAVFTAISSQNADEISVLGAWLACIAYTFQIYFDFSGYSDMAVGLGKMLGFDFKINFDYPYISRSITEFWRRWHISLGTWFREYVYIPLGGSYVKPLKHIRNMFVVWLLTGFWHGAAWNFAFWGLYYGILLTIEKYFLLDRLERAPSWISRIYTMLIVMIGWVFFSSESLGKAVSMIGIMFGFGSHPFADGQTVYYLFTNMILLGMMVLASGPLLHGALDRFIGSFRGKKSRVVAIITYVAMFLICTAFLVNDTYNPFLYFRF